jgi:hypothetical protein
MITVKSKISHLEIEKIRNNLTDQKADVLRLPIHLELGGAFGLPVSIIQLVADWSFKQPEAKLRLYSSLDDDEQLSKFAGTPHGMVSLYFSNILQGKDGHEQPAKGFRSHIIPYVMAMQESKYEGSMQGRGAFLCCFASARNEFLFPLYQSAEQKKLRSRNEFPILIQQILQKVAPEAIRRLDKNDLSNISQLVYELFSNTHHHARTDVNDNLIQRGVRGLYIKYISQGHGESREESFASNDINLNRFLIRAITEPKKKSVRNIQTNLAKSFLEISVFDTGPGLARRWIHSKRNSELDGTRANLTINEEFKLVRECFISGHTSNNEYGRGEGLPNVLESLANLRAFLRLRTGRLCLEQDFYQYSKEFSLTHWLPQQPELAETLGARFTAIIPLGVNRK